MTDTVRTLNADGRPRVAYEMAHAMWVNSKGSSPKMEDSKEFLELVSDCTHALAYGTG